MYKGEIQLSYTEAAALVEQLLASDQWQPAVKLFVDLPTWDMTPSLELCSLMLRIGVKRGDDATLKGIFEGI